MASFVKFLWGKLDYQHVLLALGFLVSAILPDALTAAQMLDLGTWVPTILLVTKYASALLLGLKQFAPGPSLASLRAAKMASRLSGVLVLAVAVGALSLTSSACKGPQSPVWTTIENTILQDIENGTALADIETAVLALDPALGGVLAAADQIIQIVITYLEQVGAIPIANQGAALALQTKIAAKLGPLGPNCVPKSELDEIQHFRLAYAR